MEMVPKVWAISYHYKLSDIAPKTNIIKEVPFGKLKDKKLSIHKTNRKGELRYRIPMSKEF